MKAKLSAFSSKYEALIAAVIVFLLIALASVLNSGCQSLVGWHATEPPMPYPPSLTNSAEVLP